MKRMTVNLISIVTVLMWASTARAQEPASPPPRPSVTVANFDTDRTGWMPPPHLGETLAELLTDRLVGPGPYRVVDRQWLVTAQDNSHRVPFDALLDRAAGAGVDYLIAGAVTRLSIERQSSTGAGVLPLPFAGGLVRKHKTESVIGLTIRVIDVRTGEVVATSTAASGASQQNSAGGGIAIIGHLPLIGGGGTSATGFQDRLLDTAVQQAITEAADRILAAAPRLMHGGK